MSNEDDVHLGSGKSPDGVAVTYHEIDRPSTIGAKGSTGFLVEVRGADGKRITHSDSLEGLKKCGYVVDAAPVAPVVPAPVAQEGVKVDDL